MSSQIESLMIERIKKGKPLSRKNAHTRIEISGHFYSVWFYSTQIAVGRVGELPFAFNLDGWNTQSTLSRLRALGFNIWAKPIVRGVFINSVTHRKNKIKQSILHIERTPMIMDDPNLLPDGTHKYHSDRKYLWSKVCDYGSWYSKDGHKLKV